MRRREMLRIGCSGIAAVVAPVAATALETRASAGVDKTGSSAAWWNVRQFGAKGDGATVDSPAINRAIDAAAAAGGGTVLFPAGTYLSYSIRLRSRVGLYLDHGAVILAGATPRDGASSGGYDAADTETAWNSYQDYDHNNWRNSLLWGEGLEDLSITGPGLIWGKGLSRGFKADESNPNLPIANKPAVGHKAIALKNCRNVLLRDFKMLDGGWDAILTTGVDNLTVDNIIIDTNRGAIDIDCCSNVRVSNCTVNSPFDDGICLKSSFALGHARPTENVTISNCYVTGGYEVGSVIDGTWKRGSWGKGSAPTWGGIGRIKLGTESNGGFLNVAISNCVFDKCYGLAVESEDGAVIEDVTITGITMRDVCGAPLFLRLGSRMRGPRDLKPSVIRRLIISDIVSSGASQLPSIISGVPGHSIEDIKISNLYLEQIGGGTAAMAALEPAEREADYPEPPMFGELPATGFFVRHVRNLEMSNVEIATRAADARPAFWLKDVVGADFFRLRVPQGSAPNFDLRQVKDFRSFGSSQMTDVTIESAEERKV